MWDARQTHCFHWISYDSLLFFIFLQKVLSNVRHLYDLNIFWLFLDSFFRISIVSMYNKILTFFPFQFSM